QRGRRSLRRLRRDGDRRSRRGLRRLGGRVPAGAPAVAAVTTQGWQGRAISAKQAVSSIRPGDRVFVGTACATPRALVDALERLDAPPAGVVLTHFLTDRVGSGDTR